MDQVVHAIGWFTPYHMGGTEKYVEQLIAGLATHSVESHVLTPRVPGAPEHYRHGNVSVHTYPIETTLSRRDARAERLHHGFDVFQSLLAEHKGAIYHQHSWTRGCGVAHLKAAKMAGLRTVLTVHMPLNTCLRETMMLYGAVPCDGYVEPQRCALCWLGSKGIGAAIARPVAALPVGVSQAAYGAPWLGPLGTALGARALANGKRNDISTMSDYADRIVAVCQWMHNALALNGVPQEKLELVPQGVDAALLSELTTLPPASPRRPGDPLRVLFLGRLHPVKGLDVLVKAVRALPPDAPIELTAHAIESGPDQARYASELRAAAANDPRITIKPALDASQFTNALRSHDVLTVPSQWMETGPLVVLEAQAASLFVLGSNLGGISEHLSASKAAMLVPYDDINAWRDGLMSLISKKQQGGLPVEARAMRSSADVASDMSIIYRGLKQA